MRIKPFVFILSLLTISCRTKENTTKPHAQKKKIVDRLHERYFLIRTLFNFSKLGISVPANAYILSAGFPGDSTTKPEVVDDILTVPWGTQCNFILNNTQLFVNAGSELALKDFGDNQNHLTFTGELNVDNNGRKACFIAGNDWQIEVGAHSKVNIMAYTNEPVVVICLAAGSATVSNRRDTVVLTGANKAVIIDKRNHQIKETALEYGDASAWMQGSIKGKGHSFAFVYRQLERLFNTHIVYRKNDYLHGMYFIPYRELTLPDILDALVTARKLRPVFREDSIYILNKE